MSDDYTKEFNDYYHPGRNEQDWAEKKAKEIVRLIGNIANRPDLVEIQNKQVELISSALKQEREIKWPTEEEILNQFGEFRDWSFYGVCALLKEWVESRRK